MNMVCSSTSEVNYRLMEKGVRKIIFAEDKTAFRTK